MKWGFRLGAVLCQTTNDVTWRASEMYTYTNLGNKEKLEFGWRKVQRWTFFAISWIATKPIDLNMRKILAEVVIFYRAHPKDGAGNIFIGVCLLTPTPNALQHYYSAGGYPVPVMVLFGEGVPRSCHVPVFWARRVPPVLSWSCLGRGGTT